MEFSIALNNHITKITASTLTVNTYVVAEHLHFILTPIKEKGPSVIKTLVSRLNRLNHILDQLAMNALGDTYISGSVHLREVNGNIEGSIELAGEAESFGVFQYDDLISA
jgi:hypothetical protein